MDKKNLKIKVRAYLNTVSLPKSRLAWFDLKYKKAYLEYLAARDNFWKIRDEYQEIEKYYKKEKE